MKKYLVSISNIVGLICLLTFVWSCEQASEPPPKPKVVRQKIIAQEEKSTIARKEKTTRPTTSEPAIKQQPVPAVPESQQPAQPSQEPKAKSPLRIAKKDDPASARKPKAKPAIPPKSDISAPEPSVEDQEPTPSGTIKPKAKKQRAKAQDLKTASKTPADNSKIAMTTPSRYSRKGKIDPFEPLVREKKKTKGKSKAGAKVTKSKRKKRAPRTPLERIDLAKLKLTAIVLAKSGNRAMVEESTGKGYVITKGTYIGTNAGKVIKIDKYKVVVAEEIEDVTGKLKIRNAELKLPKPPGDL